ncbi:hypothetical protein QUF76_16490, partial [Desulfobacterales bacterium HSG16]|nr:hypothetical protein [Desulfobacterales bacterium HSG16]
YIKGLSDLNMKESSFIADFYLWFRSGENFNDFDIDFENLISHSEYNMIDQSKEGNTYFRVYHIKSEFKFELDFHEYPFDRHRLFIQFRHARKAKAEIMYTYDELGPPLSLQQLIPENEIKLRSPALNTIKAVSGVDWNAY